MDTLSYKTVSANKETADKRVGLVNAEDLVLGRLASQVASMLEVSTKPISLHTLIVAIM